LLLGPKVERTPLVPSTLTLVLVSTNLYDNISKKLDNFITIHLIFVLIKRRSFLEHWVQINKTLDGVCDALERIDEMTICPQDCISKGQWMTSLVFLRLQEYFSIVLVVSHVLIIWRHSGRFLGYHIFKSSSNLIAFNITLNECIRFEKNNQNYMIDFQPIDE
jgi:hypothetical protein